MQGFWPELGPKLGPGLISEPRPLKLDPSGVFKKFSPEEVTIDSSLALNILLCVEDDPESPVEPKLVVRQFLQILSSPSDLVLHH